MAPHRGYWRFDARRFPGLSTPGQCTRFSVAPGIHQGRGPDPPEQVSGVSPAWIHGADVARDLRRDARPWAKAIKARVAARQMPPWHIDKTVGIQQFKNDRSLDRRSRSTRSCAGLMPARRRATPRTCRRPGSGRMRRKWGFAEMFGGPPDLMIKSAPYTIPAVAQDAWYKPVVETGLTEQRWVRAVEIRPSTLWAARSRITRSRASSRTTRCAAVCRWCRSRSLHGVGRRKTGRDHDVRTSGKLMLPGAKIIFEIHTHAVGEEITDYGRTRHLFLSERAGTEVSAAFWLSCTSIAGRRGQSHRYSAQRQSMSQDFHVMKLAGGY